jgi:hypothetical protein
MDALGLRVIWLREFDEIPVILRAAQSDNPAEAYLKKLPADRIGYRQMNPEEERGDEHDRRCQN